MLAPSQSFSRYVDVEHGHVNRKIFADEEIYQIELERIFARAWLYLAHESQLPNPGDFVLAEMAQDPVIVLRARDGKIKAFLNSCRHRGNKICRADAGNAASFVCPYHGWSYDLDGNLAGVPGGKEFYEDRLDQHNWGLVPVAQVAIYGGMIFGTFDPEAPALEEFLGDMRWGLDILLGQGDLIAVPGIARWTMEVNWKFASDNAIGDMYHAPMTHRSAMLAGHGGSNGQRAKSYLVPKKRPGFTLLAEYGHGLNANYIEEENIDRNSPLAAWRKNPETIRRLGPMREQVNRSDMNVFPNLFVNSGSRELMLRNPLGPTRIEILKTVLVDRNAAPEVQRAQIRSSNRHFGPAGMFEMDDGENWDQSTAAARGVVARRHDLNYEMAVGHGEVVVDGQSPPRIDTLTNEHAQLWLYRCWAEYMDAESWDDLKRNHSVPRGRL
jgi:phenylpropionate dioxygenase-like ring-hydroxylating dioxygenase large terminal subunit